MSDQMISVVVDPEAPVEASPTPEAVPAKKTRAKKEKTVKAEPFIVMEDAKDIFLSRIQINENDIKHNLIVHDSEVVNYRSIIPDGMEGKPLERAQAASRYPILDLIADGKNQGWINDNSSERGWKSFIKTLCDYEEKFTKMFNEVTHKDSVKFQLLPYFVQKDQLLAVKLSDDTWCGMKVTEAKIQYTWTGMRFVIMGKVIVHSGKEFKETLVSHMIPFFEGEKTFPEVGLKLPALDESITKTLIERGKHYEKIHKSGPAYLTYTGSVIRKSWWFNHEYPATGRIMIDRAGMVNIDPNYEKYFGATDSHHDRDDSNSLKIDFTDDLYFICSPYAYGFSFVAKQWGEFKVDNLQEIQFRTDSYERLVLNEGTKDILFSLTETGEKGKDIIDGKGGGCIFLLHGTPGVGKTLTAETIAETLKRPLYMVSVGELGTDVTSLEKNLRNILQVSASWNAVLLIDEVDIFLEKRDLDIHRNALVGVFLRLLEYYNGILFLTTNRVNHIDPAFYSRISLAIKYPELSADARASIWKSQTELYQITLTESEYTALGFLYHVNGRQIKNCVRIVSSLSHRRNTTPTLDDFKAVVDKVEEFNKILDKPDQPE